MKKVLSLAVLLATASNFAYAQEQLTDAGDIDDQIDAVEEAVQDDFDKIVDEERYTNTSYQDGWRGSLAISGAANTFTTDDNGVETDTDNSNFSIGARLTNGAGVWEQSMGIYYSYSKENDQDATDTLRANYELSRNFSDRFYAFTNVTANSSSNDVLDYQGFASVGLGYRIANEPGFTWRVQGGPGYSYAVSDDNDLESSGAGLVLGSRLYYQISPTAALTNDTEFNWSEDLQQVSNDFGVNFKVTENLVTRLGYVSTAKEIPDQEYSTLENNFTVSAVLSF